MRNNRTIILITIDNAFWQLQISIFQIYPFYTYLIFIFRVAFCVPVRYFFNVSRSPRLDRAGKMTCSIPSCKSQRTSTFGVPKNADLLNKWKRSLGIPLRPSSRICEVHFKPEDVIKTWVSGKGNNTYTVSAFYSSVSYDYGRPLFYVLLSKYIRIQCFKHFPKSIQILSKY